MWNALLGGLGIRRTQSGPPAQENAALARKTIVLPPDDEEVPRYPPFMKGIPLKSPESILSPHQPLIKQIKDMAALSEAEFNLYYMEALRRFAVFVHLLPASQAHHHRGAGGMIRHGIEVALWSMQGAENVLVGGSRIPRDRRNLQPRWRFAVFVAGLCHDIGKAVTDVVVLSRDSDCQWNPEGPLGLHEWGERNGVHHYVITWNEGRNKKHESANALVLGKVLTYDMTGWISEVKCDLPVWISQSVSYVPAHDNPIFDLVLKADRISVEKDAKELGLAFSDAGHDLGVPVEKILCDMMRTLLNEHVWTVNVKGSRVWVLGDSAYIIWPSGGEDLVAKISKEKMPGLPRSPESLSEFMKERGLLIKNENGDTEKYFHIAPDVLLEKMPKVRFPAIRLTSSRLLFDVMPDSVPGLVVGLNDEDYNGAVQDASADADRIGASSPASTIESGPKIVAPAQPIEATPPVTPAQEKKESRAPASIQTVPANPAIKAVPPPVTKIAEHKVGKKPIAPDPVPAKIEVDLEKQPLLYHALLAMKGDLDSGKLVWGQDARLLDTGELCIRWPDGLQGYGIEPKAFLGDLFTAGWLSLDMATPFIRCFDVVLKPGTGPVKAARIAPSVVKALRIKVKAQPAPIPLSLPSASGIASDRILDAQIQEEVEHTERAAPLPAAKADCSIAKAEILADTASIPTSPAKSKELKISSLPSAGNSASDAINLCREGIQSGKIKHNVGNGCFLVEIDKIRGWVRKEKGFSRMQIVVLLSDLRPLEFQSEDGKQMIRIPN